jgi:hypothetical protein
MGGGRGAEGVGGGGHPDLHSTLLIFTPTPIFFGTTPYPKIDPMHTCMDAINWSIKSNSIFSLSNHVHLRLLDKTYITYSIAFCMSTLTSSWNKKQQFYILTNLCELAGIMYCFVLFCIIYLVIHVGWHKKGRDPKKSRGGCIKIHFYCSFVNKYPRKLRN